MYVGMTSRGWDATGSESYGLQRVRWSGKMPFEAKAVRSRPDGFLIETTTPVVRAGALDPASYQITSFTYRYHDVYGSPVIDRAEHAVAGIQLSEDRRKIHVAVDDLREGFIYEIKMPGLRAEDGRALLHDTGYFTLNRIPDGEPLALNEMAPRTNTSSTANSIGDASSSKRTEASAGDQPKRLTEMPEEWDRPGVTLTVGTLPGLRFDIERLEVAPGERVELLFRNDDDMLHNLVVVMPGTADAVAAEAISLGLEGAAMGYVPEMKEVLYHTALLQPGTSESIYFTAPLEPGEYVFVCTFPGHAVTMRGVLKVVAP